MTEVIFALVGTGAVGALSGVAVCWPSRDRLMRSRVRDRVVVTLKAGGTFRGVLFDADARSLVLRDAEVVAPSDRPVPVDGELLVARADVAYFQRLAGGG